MSLVALEEGAPWTWNSFGEYLDALDGRIAVNAGFMVGHCALRRYVMGADAVGGQPTPEQLEQMLAAVPRGHGRGRVGASPPPSPSTHSDGDGQPVASRHARPEELLALSRAVAEHEGTQIEAIVAGCLDQFSDDEIDLFVEMSAAAGRPAELERPHHRRGRPRAGAAPADPQRAGPQGRRPDRRADHADPDPHEHVARHVLRPQPHPRLGRDPRPARRRADREAPRPGRASRDAAARGQQGGRRLPAARPLRPVRHRRHVLARRTRA